MPKPPQRKPTKLKRKEFWSFARVLLDHPKTIAAAVVFALVSAAGLGVGIVGIVVAFEQVLPKPDGSRQTLAQQIRSATDDLPQNLQPPEQWLQQLPTEPYPTLLTVILALGVLTAVGASANFLHLYCSMTLCTRAVARIRRDAFAHLLRTPLLGPALDNTADTVSRIVHDATVLEHGFRALTSRALAQITKGIASLTAALILNWQLTLITLTVAPVLATVVRKLGKRIRRASRGAMQGRAELLATSTEVIQGFRIVKVYGAEQRELERFNNSNKQVVTQELRARTARALATPIVELLALVVVGALALVAGKAIIDGELQIEEAIGVLGALAFAGNALKPLTNVIQDIQTSDAAAKRIRQVLDAPEERTTKGPPLPKHSRSITFDRVSFTYPGKSEPALNEVSITVNAHETTAFVGPNGSGKTTLLSLVPALIKPDSGRLLIDDHDIAEHDIASLRQQIGVVTQETVLFRGTIADNIAYAKPHATRDEINHALKQAHADFIDDLPDGIDTQLGDRGAALSGGQRQRLAIARAVLRDPAILIMDEATSMIDADSEAKITAALATFAKGRTVLTVAHRLSTVKNAHRIVVMDKGRIAATGTHDQLLHDSPLYQTLAHHQLAPASS